jgi:prephenate dehydratase
MTELKNNLDSAKKPRVAFQGERGAFSEEAAVKLLGDAIELVPRPTFEAMFATVEEGAADLVLAPVENSLFGSVYECYDLLLKSKLNIMAEVVLPVVHNLIGPPGATYEGVRVVQSHPVALGQCRRFFVEHPAIKRVVAEDTGGSAGEVVRAGDVSRAAIASRRAAEVYGGVILQEHLEDHPENYTRFWLLADAPPAPPGADKMSLAVFLLHQPGALSKALEPIAQRGINLVKIESRPLVGHPWEYCFYLDLLASPEKEETKAALAELKNSTREMRVLGCYVAAPAPSSRPGSARDGK